MMTPSPMNIDERRNLDITYNPAVYHRRSIRLKGYDYTQDRMYFITICTHRRQPIFGKIVGTGLAPAQIE